MAVSLRPRIRPLEVIPFGSEKNLHFAFRDPEGFGKLTLSQPEAMLALLMDGRRTLSQIQTAFQTQTGEPVALSDLETLIRQLDGAYLLAGERFDRYCREQIDNYLAAAIRPPSQAGSGYPNDSGALGKLLDECFTAEKGPGPIDWNADCGPRRLCGAICPHIDPQRGGPVYAWTYKAVAEQSDAEVFVIFGTAHHGMEELFCVTRKHFETPLGVVQTDGPFVDRLAEHLGSSVAGQQLDPFADEPAHRLEHSIEFQVVFLQHVLGGRRDFRIVPVLVGSFEHFIREGHPPGQSPEVEAFVAAVRAAAQRPSLPAAQRPSLPAAQRPSLPAAQRCPGGVCYIGAADFAHVGVRFGDPWRVDADRRSEQSRDDHTLLDTVCRCDSAALFSHVARQQDRRRICGLSAAYTLLEVIRPAAGELLQYDQAVDTDGTSCVSFASVAFYPQDIE